MLHTYCTYLLIASHILLPGWELIGNASRRAVKILAVALWKLWNLFQLPCGVRIGNCHKGYWCICDVLVLCQPQIIIQFHQYIKLSMPCHGPILASLFCLKQENICQKMSIDGVGCIVHKTSIMHSLSFTVYLKDISHFWNLLFTINVLLLQKISL